jgi:hypothetical protein
MSVLARLLDRSGAGGPVIEPMRHRHVGQILAIERATATATTSSPDRAAP